MVIDRNLGMAGKVNPWTIFTIGSCSLLEDRLLLAPLVSCPRERLYWNRPWSLHAIWQPFTSTGRWVYPIALIFAYSTCAGTLWDLANCFPSSRLKLGWIPLAIWSLGFCKYCKWRIISRIPFAGLCQIIQSGQLSTSSPLYSISAG